MANDSNNTALIFGGMVIIGGVLILYLKGCDLGIKFFCRAKIEEAPPTTESLFPRERLTTVMEYIANQAVEDIDANTFLELGRDRKFELKALLFDKYKTWMEDIAEYNDVRLQPLQGRALAKYSQLVLDLCRRTGIRLNPAGEAMFRANLFAGSQNVGNITANRAAVASLYNRAVTTIY